MKYFVILGLYLLGLALGWFCFIPGDREGLTVKNREGANVLFKPEQNQAALFSKNKEKEEFWRKVFHAKNNDEFREMLSLLLQDKSNMDHYAIKCLFNAWAELSPKEALLATEKFENLVFRESLQFDVFSTWSERNPEGLARYYSENREELYNRFFVVSLAAERWAETAPVEAMKWLSTLNAQERNEGFLSILEKTVERNPSYLKQVVAVIPEKQLNDPVQISNIMKVWAVHDPQAALQWRAELTPEQQEILSGYENLKPDKSLKEALKEYESNPAALVAKVKEYPEKDQQGIYEELLRLISQEKGNAYVKEWIDQNLYQKIPDAKTRFVDRYGTGAERDIIPSSEKTLEEEIRVTTDSDKRKRLLTSYHKDFSSRNYQESLSFLESQGEKEFMPQMLIDWAYNEPDNARLWLEKSSLFTAEEKKTMESQFETPVLIIKPKP